jgi:hypothetical protein
MKKILCFLALGIMSAQGEWYDSDPDAFVPVTNTITFQPLIRVIDTNTVHCPTISFSLNINGTSYPLGTDVQNALDPDNAEFFKAVSEYQIDSITSITNLEYGITNHYTNGHVDVAVCQASSLHSVTSSVCITGIIENIAMSNYAAGTTLEMTEFSLTCTNVVTIYAWEREVVGIFYQEVDPAGEPTSDWQGPVDWFSQDGIGGGPLWPDWDSTPDINMEIAELKVVIRRDEEARDMRWAVYARSVEPSSQWVEWTPYNNVATYPEFSHSSANHRWKVETFIQSFDEVRFIQP